jgi:hypothetical protein
MTSAVSRALKSIAFAVSSFSPRQRKELAQIRERRKDRERNARGRRLRRSGSRPYRTDGTEMIAPIYARKSTDQNVSDEENRSRAKSRPRARMT